MVQVGGSGLMPREEGVSGSTGGGCIARDSPAALAALSRVCGCFLSITPTLPVGSASSEVSLFGAATSQQPFATVWESPTLSVRMLPETTAQQAQWRVSVAGSDGNYQLSMQLAGSRRPEGSVLVDTRPPRVTGSLRLVERERGQPPDVPSDPAGSSANRRHTVVLLALNFSRPVIDFSLVRQKRCSGVRRLA